MKLFTSAIDKQLFAQYNMGNDLENQKVVAKIFNPYGAGTWYLLNSDPNDPDYIWAIVDLIDIEMGSVSRSELESIKVPPFRLPLERDTSFSPINALELYRGLKQGKRYADGGTTDFKPDVEIVENKLGKNYLFPKGSNPDTMGIEFKRGGNIKSFRKDESYRLTPYNSIERSIMERVPNEKEYKLAGNFYIKGHNNDAYIYFLDEFDRDYVKGVDIKPNERIYRYITRNSAIGGMMPLIKINVENGLAYYPIFEDEDVLVGFDKRGQQTEYLNLIEADESDYYANGGFTDASEDYIISDGSGMYYSRSLTNGNVKWNDSQDMAYMFSKAEAESIKSKLETEGYSNLSVQKYDKEWWKKMENGGETEEGVDLFEDYDDIPKNVQKVLDKHSAAFEDGDYRDLEKAHKDLLKIGYTFEYDLDGQAYDLRKIGQKGKSEEYGKGGYMADGGYMAKTFEVEYEINGKKEKSLYSLYPNDRVENLLPPTAKIISIKEKMADGGYMADGGLIGGLTADEAIYLYVKKALVQKAREKYLKPAGLWNTPKSKDVEQSLIKKGFLNNAGAITELGKNKAREVDSEIGQMISREYISGMNTVAEYRKLVEKFGSADKMAKGGKTESEETVYIEYLNKAKKFAKDKKEFKGETAYKEAISWGRKNIPNFNADMVKFKMADGGYMEKGGEIIVTSIKDIPNFDKRLKEGKITYRGIGLGKFYDRFFRKYKTDGYRIKVDEKEYLIDYWDYSRIEKLRDEDGNILVKFYDPSKMADGGMMENGGMSENLDLYINYERTKIDEYEIVRNMLTLNALQKNGFIEFTYDTGKDKRRYAMEHDKFRSGLGGEPKYIRPRYIKSAIMPRFSYKNKEYFIGYQKGINFLRFYVLKKGNDWDKYNKQKMEKGGQVKFADKVKSIKSSLLKRKKVSPSVQKDYGKTYSPKEAEESAKRIVGAMLKKRQMK